MKGVSSRMLNGTDGTHVEDMKNPDKVLFPSGNLVLVFLRKDESVNWTPLPMLGGHPLNLRHSSGIQLSVSRLLECGSLVLLTWSGPQSHRGRAG